MEESTTLYWPFIVYTAAVLAIMAVIVAVSAVLGERHREAATGAIYESGIVSTGSARIRFDAKFYQMAMFFVIFDLESVFIYAYAVAFREVGWTGYIEAFIFIVILVAALLYLWRIGELDWGTVKHLKESETLRRRASSWYGRMRTARHILRRKTGRLYTISADASVHQALTMMVKTDIGALVVIDQGRLAGIISERDCAEKLILKGKSSKDTPVRQIMTHGVPPVDPDKGLEACMELMTQYRAGHLPVIENGRVVGIISVSDIVKGSIGWY